MSTRRGTKTIWSRGAIPPAEWKYRNLKRVALPLTDILFVVGGILGARFGIPALDDIYPWWVADLGAYAFSVVAFMALVGVAFPKLWLLELWAKSVIIGLIATYLGALLVAAVTIRATATYVIPIAMICIILPSWRISLLSAEARERGQK